MNVKFGVQHGTNAAFTRLKTKDYMKSIQYCEKAGYESISVMDHLNSVPPNAEVVSCDIILSAAAVLTENVKIGSVVSDPHRKHPAQIALDSLTLQRLSNNRFILGLGAGEGMNLNDFGIKWNKPAKRLVEAVEVIKLLWKTAQSRKLVVDYSGEFFQLKNARLQYPTKVLPKLWIGSNGPKMIEFTGKVADGWIPASPNPKLYKKNLKTLEKAGRIDEITKACEVFILISDDKPDMAKQIARTLGSVFCLNPLILDEYNIKIPEEFTTSHHWKLSMSEILKSSDAARKFATENVPEEVIDSMIISGSSDDCIEQLNEYIEAGVEYFAIEIFGLGDYFKATELFTEKVFSYFKEN